MIKSKPLFQRRHYEIIAEVLGQAMGNAKGDFLRDLETVFQRDNPHFDKAKFRLAVGDAMFSAPNKDILHV